MPQREPDGSGALGELLVLLHGADSRVRTFVGTYEERVNRPELLVGSDQAGQRTLRWAGRGAVQRPTAMRRDIWFEAPHKMRVELSAEQDTQWIGVRNDKEWWRWDQIHGEDGGQVGPEDDAALPALLRPALLFPSVLVARFRFHGIGYRSRVGRTVLAARADSRRLPCANAKRTFEFEVDASYGTVLRWVIFEREQAVHVTEAVSVRFDEPMSQEHFTPVVRRAGEEFRGTAKSYL